MSGCSAGNAASQISNARRCNGSALPAACPRSTNMAARLSNRSAMVGCPAGNAASLISNARRCNGSASSACPRSTNVYANCFNRVAMLGALPAAPPH